MTLLRGADSAVPQPEFYPGHDVWGVYVAGDTFHVWSKAEVAALGAGGVRGILPIVVPDQKANWWGENDGYGTLEALVRAAVAWGLPEGSPLVLDVEEGQAVHVGVMSCHAWAIACGVHHYLPWLYSSSSFLSRDTWCHHWLAHWYEAAGTDHVAPDSLPANTLGWQYAGDVEGGRIDRDIFASGHTFLTPELKVETIVTLNPGEAAFGTPVAPSTESATAGVPATETEPAAAAPAESDTAATESVAPPAVAVPEPESVAAAESPAGPDAPATVSIIEAEALKAKAVAEAKLLQIEDKLHDWVSSFFA